MSYDMVVQAFAGGGAAPMPSAGQPRSVSICPQASPATPSSSAPVTISSEPWRLLTGGWRSAWLTEDLETFFLHVRSGSYTDQAFRDHGAIRDNSKKRRLRRTILKRDAIRR